MISYVAVLATARDGVAVVPTASVSALRLPGIEPASRFDGGAFACAAGSSPGDSHGIRVEGEIVAVGDVRLDGRGQLTESLSLTHAGSQDHGLVPDDLAIVVAAFRRWGTAAIERLRGDFSLVIWDRRTRTLIAARDGLGVRPLYYAEVTGGLVIGNVFDAIRAYPGVGTTLNDTAVASFLRYGWNVEFGETTFSSIRRLAPGTALRSGTELARAVVTRHWTMPDPEPVELSSDAEYLARYRSLLSEAVGDRVDPRGTLLFLSGGMDSTTIAVAAREAAPGARLAALTWRATGVQDESEVRLAADVARRYDISHYVRDVAPFDVLGPHAQTPEPVAEPEQGRISAVVASVANDTRATIAIEGEDGDALFSPPGVASMWRRESPLRVAGRLIRYLIRERRKPYVGLWLARRFGMMPPAGDAPGPDWMTPVALAALPARSSFDGTPVSARPEAAAALTRSIWQGLHDTYGRASTNVPIDYRWPLLDTRLIEFVFAIPAVPWCQRKLLARRAFADGLPSEVVARPKTAVPGYHDALVADWRRRRGRCAASLSDVTARYVDEAALCRALDDTRDPHVVMSAWRALAFDAWARGAAL